MAYEQRDNSGSLFINDRKEKETHPDRTGTAMIDGVEYYVSGWVKQDRNGKMWMSMAFKKKQQGAAQAGAVQETAPAGRPAMSGYLNKRDMNDDIPF